MPLLGYFINKFIISSITTDSIIISWDVIPRDNSTLTLSISDSHQTFNNIINVTGDVNIYMYEFAELLSACNVYTFKLTISNGCEKSISTGIKQITKHCNYY